MSAMASGEDSSTKRPPADEGTMDQGESKKAAIGDKASPADAKEVQYESTHFRSFVRVQRLRVAHPFLPCKGGRYCAMT